MGLYPVNTRIAEEHRKELSEALRSRLEIRDMTRNPVMLTALAVVHWNERRLPEQRADLYDSILTWLSRQRESMPGREKPERCMTLLGILALAMQNQFQGRQVRISASAAAKILEKEFGHPSSMERLRRTAQFLEQEMADSGIIVSRGDELQFWHLIFQEYMAAQTIAGQKERDQLKILFHDDKIHKPEWREVVLLLAGILAVKQGKPKVDVLISAILERSGIKLAEQARTAGLVGAIVNDLRPLSYQPSHAGYPELMDAVLGVFDLRKMETVEFAVRLEAAEALGQVGDPRIAWNNWVRIDAGSFQMGALTSRKAVLKAFDIGRYPVTVAEYRRFVEDEGYLNKRWWTLGSFVRWREPRSWDNQKEHPNRPVTGVSWYEAAAYGLWAGARLPSAAEWERAARGTEGRKYPWGNDKPDATRANYAEGGPGTATPVGLYPLGATPDGILDLAGNVSEWVGVFSEDWHDEGKVWELRGGSWLSDASQLRSTEKISDASGSGDVDIGFRLVRDVSVF
jgi:formylglycine-generating enzyme required for sulfatase activity